MKRDIRIPLSVFFTAWIVFGNLLWWFGPEKISHLIGDGLIWSTVIPLSCLAILNPRRAANCIAAVLAGIALLALTKIDRHYRQRRRRRFTQAIPS